MTYVDSLILKAFEKGKMCKAFFPLVFIFYISPIEVPLGATRRFEVAVVTRLANCKPLLLICCNVSSSSVYFLPSLLVMPNAHAKFFS